jgi:polar amino acid transport system substrate-binding protein
MPNHCDSEKYGGVIWMNSRGIAAIALIIGIVIGVPIGIFGPTLIPQPPQPTWVQVIQARGNLIVGTDVPWPPFEIFNTTSSQYEGFDIDLATMIADYLNVTVTFVDMDFDALIPACKQGDLDMLASAMFVTPERALELAHSVPYIRVNQVVITKNASVLTISSLEDLEGYTVGVQTGTAEDWEIQDLIDAGYAITRVAYPKADLLINDLVADNIDCAYVDEPVLDYYRDIYNLKKILTVLAPPTVFYCRWETPSLMTAINNVIIGAYTDGTLDDLVVEWFGG